MTEHHALVHQGVGPSGGEEWLCRECGRHLVVRWDPDFEEVVLSQGDLTASHSGSRHGRVSISPARVGPSDIGWLEWLRAHGLDEFEN